MNWDELMYAHTDGYDLEFKPLEEWTYDDLIFARTYIGKELNRRALVENPDATESLLQEKSPA
jgi:hypothetical protein